MRVLCVEAQNPFFLGGAVMSIVNNRETIWEKQFKLL